VLIYPLTTANRDVSPWPPKSRSKELKTISAQLAAAPVYSQVERRTSGIVTLIRAALAKVGSPARSNHRMPRLFAALALARGDGRDAKLLRALARVDLLILDDWGPEQLNAEQRRDLLEIVEDRYDARSIVITSQLPVERWYEIIGNPTLADAILDRIIHNEYRIELTGDSMRKLKTEEAEREAPSPHLACSSDARTGTRTVLFS
jgi:hypothetical protein